MKEINVVQALKALKMWSEIFWETCFLPRRSTYALPTHSFMSFQLIKPLSRALLHIQIGMIKCMSP